MEQALEMYDESLLKKQVENALKSVAQILENNRAPKFASAVLHKYDDKFRLAEYLTKMTIASYINCLNFLGLNEKDLKTIIEWSKTKSVTIRFSSEETCKFDKKVAKEIEQKNLEIGGILKVTNKTITTVQEYYYNFEAHHELSLYAGNDLQNKLVIRSKTGKTQILVTDSEVPPKPASSVAGPFEVDITSLLRHIDEKLQISFEIDRQHKECHTPRRNEQIQKLLHTTVEFAMWAELVGSYFKNRLFPVQVNHNLDLSQMNSDTIFQLCVPLFEENLSKEKLEEKFEEKENKNVGLNLEIISNSYENQVILPSSDIQRFLSYHKQTIASKIEDLVKVFKDDEHLISPIEGIFCTIFSHICETTYSYLLSINFIENLLRDQLIAAIGKEVNPVDFNNYMIFHNRKLFKEEFEPQRFCYAVRRPGFFPEGVISIETPLGDGAIPEPLTTFASHQLSTTPMSCSINAATNILIRGDKYLHGWLNYSFNNSQPQLSLNVRAKQFSCFIVLLGNLISANQFEAKYALIVKNKDDISVPIDMTTIPSKKEFKDATASLSPEQKKFAKAYRAMQLESSLFTICVIQIKPQLEKVLNLPPHSLTKEIQLTQDLLELFITYQIPSDLLSFSSDEKRVSTTRKIEFVKQQVTAMKAMIKNAKEKELEEKERERAYLNTPIPPVSPVSSSVTYCSLPIEPEMCFMSAPTLNNYECESADCFSYSLNDCSVAESCCEYEEFSMPDIASSSAICESAPAPPDIPVSSATPAPPQPTEQAKDQNNDEIPLETPTQTINNEVDFTKLPAKLDTVFNKFDPTATVRPTTLSIGDYWKKNEQKGLLSKPETSYPDKSTLESDRNKAFDLLDSLTRSGGLPVDDASLHVVVATTHCFALSLINTLIKDNVNPIEKVERSSILVASAVHDQPPSDLINYDQLKRLEKSSPLLFN